MFKYDGNVIVTTAAAATTKGDPVVVGDLFGVATDDAASGAELVVALSGVYSGLPCDGQATSKGAKAYWDATNSQVTKDADDGETTPTAYPHIGYFFEAVTASDAVCTVKLLG